jgi:hypothetical protein
MLTWPTTPKPSNSGQRGYQAACRACNCNGTPMSRFALVMLLLMSFAASPSVLAGEVTISQLLSNPLAFDGRHVTVSGTAQDVKLESSSWGGHKFETYKICEHSCVNVFAVGHPGITDGERIAVKGTFNADVAYGPFVLHDEILEDEGSP